MVTYNPKDWFKLITQFHKSDRFRQLFFSHISIGVYAEEIEDPFGEDENDLPLDDIYNRIKNNLNEIFN